jgi:hypothetical protein
MNKAVLIARNDHDVYFVELLPSDRQSPRALALLAGKALLERYPGFSRETAFDFGVVRTRERRWLMVTAIERRELDGYRRVAPFRRLATATSALVRDRRFFELPVSRYGDELIGYNAERDEPVSQPLTERDVGSPEGSVDIAKAARRFRAAVFPRPSRNARLRAFPFAIAAFAAALIAVAALVCAGFGNPAGSQASLTDTGLTAGLPGSGTESVSFPGACRALVDISSALLSARGTLDAYSYDETADRPVRVEVRGCDPLELGDALSRIAYLSKPEYGRIEYDGTVPRFELAFAAVDGVRNPTAREGKTVPSDEIFLSVLRGQRLRAAHIDRDGSNGFSLGIGAGEMNASMGNMLSSMDRFGARLSVLSVRVLRTARAFDVACSIVMDCGTESAPFAGAPSEGDWMRVDDAAGFPDVGRIAAARIVGTGFDGGIAGSGISAGTGRIGKIIDLDGGTITFMRGADGKISMRGE